MAFSEEESGKQAARDALWRAIEGAAKQAENYQGPTRAAIVRDAAMAYRFVAGGAQPGGAVAEKSSS